MKLIIFDIDGTLTDTKKVDDNSFIKAFEEVFKRDISNQNWEEIQNVTDWGITEEVFIQEFGYPPTNEDFQLMKNVFVKILLEERKRNENQFKEVNGAKSFFNLLYNNENVALGIGTGGWEESALVKLEAINIHPNDIPFSNANFSKDREGIVKHVITQAEEKYNWNFQDIVYFGDGLWDFKTCRNLNIPFVGIDILKDGRLKTLGAPYVFPDFLDVDEILNVIGLS